MKSRERIACYGRSLEPHMGFWEAVCIPEAESQVIYKLTEMINFVIAIETLYPFCNDCTIVQLFKIIETGWQKGLQQRS